VRGEDWLVDPPATIRETETVPIPALRGKIIIVFLPLRQVFFMKETIQGKGTRTAEFVSPGHPDKVCDRVADTLLDAYMEGDPEARVAVETMGGHDLIVINGEVTARGVIDIEAIVRGIVGDGFRVISGVAEQSPEIAQGVDTGGAGDQGIMKGYATRETESRMPLEYELARDLCRRLYEVYPYDGKTQVTVVDGRVTTALASFQNSRSDELLAKLRELIEADEYLANPAGEWRIGGFDADSGLSGRKLVIDSYGPEVGIGGGSFSGKDYTKVDRSGAYMARRVAVDYLEKYGAQEVTTKLAYAIGKPDPVMAVAVVDGREIPIVGYDLSPRGIREALGLRDIRFTDTAVWGHFGRGFPWDGEGSRD